MKTNKQRGRIKAWPYLLALGLIVCITVAVSMKLIAQEKERSSSDISRAVNYGSPTTEQIEAGEEIKKGNEESEEQMRSEYSIFIVDASQYGTFVEVRSYIDGIVSSEGKCNFVFSNSMQMIEEHSEVILGASTSTCSSISVPVSSFLSTGAYSLTISYDDGNVSAVSDKQSVEVSR